MMEIDLVTVDEVMDTSSSDENHASSSHPIFFGTQSGTTNGEKAFSTNFAHVLLVPMNGHVSPQPVIHVCDQNGDLIPIGLAPLHLIEHATLPSVNQILSHFPLPNLHQNVCSAMTGSAIGLQLLSIPGTNNAELPIGATPVVHNLIPQHLQASTLAQCLNGKPGYQPALVLSNLAFPANINHGANNHVSVPLLLQPAPPLQPVLTIQDRPLVHPVFNGVNPSYPGLRQVHLDPPVFVVDNFLTPFECDFLVHAADDSWTPAPVVGKGAGEISSSRTSSTCYLAREDLPDYMRKVSILTNKPIEHCELPQVGRYLPTQQYLHHFDAFDLSNEDGVRFASNGGQRVVTVLVYLNDCFSGGQTQFPALNLEVSPRRGTALVFYPASVDGYLDKRALHAALPAVDVKFVSQVWIRQTSYNGLPSKRLRTTLGTSFDATSQASNLLGQLLPVQA